MKWEYIKVSDVENTLMVIWEKEEGRLKLDAGINIHQLLRIK